MPVERLSDMLSPTTLARIDNYELLARVVVEGAMAGMHRSVYRGSGSEFVQYRDYTPGDDLKYADWKVFARRDRFYTKMFQEETNMNCTVVLDASASMAYRGERAECSKFRYGSMVTACLLYLASRQGDNIGFHCYSDKQHVALPAGRGRGRLNRIFADLTRIQPRGVSRHAEFLPYVVERLRHRGLVVLISDFLETEETLPPLLRGLRHAGNDCIVIQVLDPDELDLPFTGATRLVDSENGQQILTAPAAVRADYVAAMQAFIERLRGLCHDTETDHLLCPTSGDIGVVLSAYLHRRGTVY